MLFQQFSGCVCKGVLFHGSEAKESACSAGDKEDMGWIPGSGRYHGGGNGNPLQDYCLKNPMDKGAWWAPNCHKESDITEWLSMSMIADS